MKRVVPFLALLFVLGMTGRCLAVPSDAIVSGVVRDAKGAPQMGALVELMRADASLVATALTDAHGRFIMISVLPGKYQLRASAALFMPSVRQNIQLRAGAQSVINLTMTTLFEAENWLPAQRRQNDEPADDWKWTLRSTASRPLLRLTDPTTGLALSSSAEQVHPTSNQGRLTVTNGDGSFGAGGMHQVIVLNRSQFDGDGTVFRADLGDPPTPFPVGPSVAMTAGYERRGPMGGSTRMVTTYQSHPELTGGGDSNGLQILQIASTQEIPLGDAVLIDVGTLMQAERLHAKMIEAEPYLSVTTRPGEDVVVEYRWATGRQLQRTTDLDGLKPPVDVISDTLGRPMSTKGSHQELSISKKLDGRVLTLAAYTDSFQNGTIAGSGMIDRTAQQGLPLIADPTTSTFHLTTMGYSGRGVSASVMQPITPALSAWMEYDLGTALWGSGADNPVPTIADIQKSLTAKTAQAASFALKGKLVHTGTSLKAEYRWQPVRTLTPVNAYNTLNDEAYLNFYVRQKLWCGRFLPEGLDAVVEATNLLEQGYQPVLAPDGHTLFLAQVPRAIRGGLAFNF